MAVPKVGLPVRLLIPASIKPLQGGALLDAKTTHLKAHLGAAFPYNLRSKLSPRFQLAMVVASRLHQNQKRKITKTPYMAHLLSVAGVVLGAGGTEDEAIAALLHDVVEDQAKQFDGKRTQAFEFIHKHFGPNVAKIVNECTEPLDDKSLSKKDNWDLVKKAYIKRIASISESGRLVMTADKIHNCEDILRCQDAGLDPYAKFTVEKKKTLWFYRTVAQQLQQHSKDRRVINLLKHLNRVVTSLERYPS